METLLNSSQPRRKPLFFPLLTKLFLVHMLMKMKLSNECLSARHNPQFLGATSNTYPNVLAPQHKQILKSIIFQAITFQNVIQYIFLFIKVIATNIQTKTNVDKRHEI